MAEGNGFPMTQQGFETRPWYSLPWLFNPIRNVDERISYENVPSWELRLFAERGHPPIKEMFANHYIPTVSQYRALMPPKNPFEGPWPTAGLFAGMIYWMGRNKYMGMRPYAGLFTRGLITMAIPFSILYYADRHMDMKRVGVYKLSLDYIRNNTDNLEPIPKKKFKDQDMLPKWNPTQNI